MRSPLQLNSIHPSLKLFLPIGHPRGSFPSLIQVALLPGAKVPSCCKPSSSNVMFANSPPPMPKSIYILGFWLKLGEGDVGAVIGGGGGGAEDLMFG